MNGDREREISQIAFRKADMLVLARSLYATAGTDDIARLEAISNAALNRLIYERELDCEAEAGRVFSDPAFFPCWREPKLMEKIDTEGEGFLVCFRCAKRAASGRLSDTTSGSIRWHGERELPAWAAGLSAAAAVGGFLFYNNCG